MGWVKSFVELKNEKPDIAISFYDFIPGLKTNDNGLRLL